MQCSWKECCSSVLVWELVAEKSVGPTTTTSSTTTSLMGSGPPPKPIPITNTIELTVRLMSVLLTSPLKGLFKCNVS